MPRNGLNWLLRHVTARRPAPHLGRAARSRGIPVPEKLTTGRAVSDAIVVADAARFRGQPQRSGGSGFLLHRRVSDHQGALRPRSPLRTPRRLLQRADSGPTRTTGTGKAIPRWRVVYQHKSSRYRHDKRAIVAMITRAEKITAGVAPMPKARLVEVTGAEELDQGRIDLVRQLAGLKGCVMYQALPGDGRAVRDRPSTQPLRRRTHLQNGYE